MQFIGIKWKNDLKEPFLQYRKDFTLPENDVLRLLDFENISIKVSDKRICMGHSSQEYGKAPCPYNTEISFLDTQCSYCRKQDSTYFMSLDGLDIEQIEKLKTQPHLNYVNVFGLDVSKTGVASIHKKFGRVLEQASSATIFFTECDGYTARLIESFVSRTLHIKQAHTWETKIKLLNKIISKEDAKNFLFKIFDDIKNIMPEKYAQFMKVEPEFYYNIDYYHIKDQGQINNVNIINTLSPGDVISGEIRGIFGEIVLLKNKDVLYAFSTKSLLGTIIEVNKSLFELRLSNPVKLIDLVDKPTSLEMF